jgi:hypothetical protein
MRRALVVIGVFGLLTACVPPAPTGTPGTFTTTVAGSTSTTTIDTTSTSVPPSGGPCAGTGTPPATWDHVALIIFENKPLKKIISNTADAPYLNSLANSCSYSDSMESLATVSLANYVALTSGFTGHNGGVEVPITSNSDPSVWPQDSTSLFELIDAGRPTTSAAAVEWAEVAAYLARSPVPAFPHPRPRTSGMAVCAQGPDFCCPGAGWVTGRVAGRAPGCRGSGRLPLRTAQPPPPAGARTRRRRVGVPPSWG